VLRGTITGPAIQKQ